MENSPLCSVVAKQGKIFHNLTKSTKIFAPAARFGEINGIIPYLSSLLYVGLFFD